MVAIATFTATMAKEWTREEVVSIINKVNNTWQKENPNSGRAFWDNAVYHTGNMEAVRTLKNEKWAKYSMAWAEQNQWMGATEPDAKNWRYKQYGEGMQHVLFGDWQICFQTYIDLYMLENVQTKKNNSELALEQKVKRAIEVMGYEADNLACDYWWWADALYMVMPVMTKLYNLTGDEKYLDKMFQNWEYANSIMLDEETGLYFRDGKYIYPKHKTNSGKKDFWARGDGWVMAAFAKVLKDLPENCEYSLSTKYHREYLKACYKKMAKSVKACQQEEGYWTRSLLDPEFAPGRESSGTALFTYALFWGINNGVLPAKDYAATAEKAWSYLAEIALQKNGTVGYMQPIGEKAIPGQTLSAKSVTNFGTGAFLLAACEYLRYLER